MYGCQHAHCLNRREIYFNNYDWNSAAKYSLFHSKGWFCCRHACVILTYRILKKSTVFVFHPKSPISCGRYIAYDDAENFLTLITSLPLRWQQVPACVMQSSLSPPARGGHLRLPHRFPKRQRNPLCRRNREVSCVYKKDRYQVETRDVVCSLNTGARDTERRLIPCLPMCNFQFCANLLPSWK